MKITLDIDKLLETGSITREEYSRLLLLASQATASLALNVVLAFGIVAVAAGILALLASPVTMVALGLAVTVLSGVLCAVYPARWMLLGSILLPLGSLTAAGGILILTEANAGGFSLVAGLLLLGAVVTRSGLLASLATFALLSALGGATGYTHAEYFLCIEAPLLTVGVFGLLALAAHIISLFVGADHARIATICSRTAVVIANFGFWVGSLWGDRGSVWGQPIPGIFHSTQFFVVGWAVAIILTGVFGAVRNRAWLVNTAATFGAIHLYTQWFEYFNATPGSLIMIGIFTIGIAVGLITYNRRMKGIAPQPVAR